MPSIIIDGIEYQLVDGQTLPSQPPEIPKTVSLEGKYRDENGTLREFKDLPYGTKIKLELTDGTVISGIVGDTKSCRSNRANGKRLR